MSKAKKPEIFLSYSWADKKIADKIYYDLTFVGFTVIKDDHSIKYSEKISDFMKKIRKSDFAILLICDSYLRSINCMTEVMQLDKDDNVWDKVLPVVDKDIKIYDPIDRIKYASYWSEKAAAIEEALRNLDPVNVSSVYDELKNYRGINQNISLFLLNVKDRLNVTPEKLFGNFYKEVLDKIGAKPDFKKVVQLATIAFIPDPHLRLTKINGYIKNLKTEYSDCYGVLAACHQELKQTKKAIQFYKKAVELDDFNYTAWNNLGRIYEISEHNYNSAKYCYEKAISAYPNFDVPRLNLGVLLSERFKDEAGAKAQYEEILKFDESSCKAHNNLGSIYRTRGFLNLDEAERHFLVAVRQNHIPAMMNYANFLRVVRKDPERSIRLYQSAKDIDSNNMYGEFIEALMKSGIA